MQIQKLLSTTALMAALVLPVMAYAHEEMHGEEGPPPFMGDVMSKMSADGAKQFKETMKKDHENTREIHEHMKKLHDEMYDIITAPTFDKSAYLNKAAEMEKLHNQMHEHMNDAFADALSKLSISDRKAFADAMKEKMEHMREEHRMKHHHDKDDDKSDK